MPRYGDDLFFYRQVRCSRASSVFTRELWVLRWKDGTQMEAKSRVEAQQIIDAEEYERTLRAIEQSGVRAIEFLLCPKGGPAVSQLTAGEVRAEFSALKWGESLDVADGFELRRIWPMPESTPPKRKRKG